MASDNARALLDAIVDSCPFIEGWTSTSIVREKLGWSQQKYAAVVKRAIDCNLVEVDTWDGLRLIRATDAGQGARVASDIAEAQASSSEAGSISAITGALESMWKRFQEDYSDLPDARIIIASGRQGRVAKHGHWHADQWKGDADHEVLIAGERLNDGAAWVAETLLHEAVHGIAHGRGIQDTSRQGRWHNKKFGALCDEVGLIREDHPSVGVVTKGLTDQALTRYAPEIMVLEAALSGTARKAPPVKDPSERKARVPWKAALQAIVDRCAEEAKKMGDAGEFANELLEGLCDEVVDALGLED